MPLLLSKNRIKYKRFIKILNIINYKKDADVVFCNDVFEHIPEPEIPAFINVLEESGKYIFASISLRDAVNYTAIPESLLLENAREVSSPTGIVLTKDISGDYIFSLHISVLPKNCPSFWTNYANSRSSAKKTVLPTRKYNKRQKI